MAELDYLLIENIGSAINGKSLMDVI